ncbi:hypothetical protein ETD83_07700 [Actinomadura soli]|uniref:Uncharacterized protein n=1 Tax=Actinomadura soli TaxID=2508997 RepID=A0A5C4JHH3_9ACTN|nr:hypothetical protein [Actinomadura soli]TMR04923.1 hypothetical protein ETD83_07700 [Actinomadura soli]
MEHTGHSSGLRAIIAAWKQAKRFGGWLILLNPARQVANLLATHLHTLTKAVDKAARALRDLL